MTSRDKTRKGARDFTLCQEQCPINDDNSGVVNLHHVSR
jgi:hypothetical protein